MRPPAASSPARRLGGLYVDKLVCASLLIALLLLAGCSSSGPSKIHSGPEAPTEMTFRSRSPLASLYSTSRAPASLKGFEGEILKMLQELRAELKQQPLQISTAAQAMTRDVCVGLRAEGPPPSRLVTYAMHSQGMISPPPHFVVADVPPGLEIKARQGLTNRVRRVLREGSFNEVGIALQVPILTPKRRRLVIALVERRVTLLRALPRHLTRGQQVPVVVSVDKAFSQPHLVVAEPTGKISNALLRAATDEPPHLLRCSSSGVYQVEVTAEGRFGMEVLANFPVYCIAKPPAEVEYTLATLTLDGVEQMEEELLELTNGIRSRAGLRPLALNMPLAAVAQQHSKDMRDNNFVGHRSETTGRPTERLTRAGLMHLLVRENVARGYSASDIIAGLMDSPAHRGNILARDVTRIGIGVAIDSSVKPPVMFVTQNFIRPGTAYHPDTARKTVVQLIQGRRKLSRLPPLTVDEVLDQHARKYVESVTSGVDRKEAEAELNEELDKLGRRFSQVDSLRVQLKVIEALSQAKAFMRRGYTHMGVGVGERKGQTTILLLLGRAR